MKEKLVIAAAIAVIGCSPGEFVQAPVYKIDSQPKDNTAQTTNATVSIPTECTDFPQIEKWAGERNLDPLFVRAFALTESGLNEGAAAKACSKAVIGSEPDCLPANLSGNSEGYWNGYDEIYDPRGAYKFPIAKNSGSQNPDWRWVSFGLMQNIEPPYTFWPAQASPSGSDGQHYAIFKRSGFAKGGVNLDQAKACNPKFNPFNADDSLCLGTLKLSVLMNHANMVITLVPALTKSIGKDHDKMERLKAFIASEEYNGYWGANTRTPKHPSCPSNMTNGDCWVMGFTQSTTFDASYCSSSLGKKDTSRCKNGKPRMEPPNICNGYTDFTRYVRDCEAPFLAGGREPGTEKLKEYDALVKKCKR